MNAARWLAAVATLPLLAALGAAPAWADPPCGTLRNARLVDLADAPTNILSAVDVPAAKDQAPETYVPNSFSATPIAGGVPRARDLPAYCRVTGTIAPQVKFELRMPAEWNGKFLMQGCGGMCGVLNMEAVEDGLIRGYAVVNTNMGHEGDAGATLWAKDNMAARIDFGWRATHVVALASKALIAEYYGRPPRLSYFRGYSTGGNQAMMEAQRFPEDFNGILATAPAWAGSLPLFWAARASIDEHGQSLISGAKVRMMHEAVLRACGGEKDGYITDPPSCRWQPDELKCEGAEGPQCLTARELGAVRRIYDGAEDEAHYRVTPGMPKGSELGWLALYVFDPGIPWPQIDNLPLWAGPLVTLLARDLDLYFDPGPQFTVAGMDFLDFARSTQVTAPFRYALNPDLREFKAHGGKLLLFQGWNDPEVPAPYALDYYQVATRTMGGPEATQSFFRLFFMPGMAHTRGGQGADAVDQLTALEDWVEHGRAPDSIITYHLKVPQNYMGIPALRYPMQADAFDYTRPVYPYPKMPAYSGAGDYNDAANWRPVDPPP